MHIYFTVMCSKHSTTQVKPKVKNKPKNPCNKETNQEIQERKWENFPV